MADEIDQAANILLNIKQKNEAVQLNIFREIRPGMQWTPTISTGQTFVYQPFIWHYHPMKPFISPQPQQIYGHY